MPFVEHKIPGGNYYQYSFNSPTKSILHIQV